MYIDALICAMIESCYENLVDSPFTRWWIFYFWILPRNDCITSSFEWISTAHHAIRQQYSQHPEFSKSTESYKHAVLLLATGDLSPFTLITLPTFFIWNHRYINFSVLIRIWHQLTGKKCLGQWASKCCSDGICLQCTSWYSWYAW